MSTPWKEALKSLSKADIESLNQLTHTQPLIARIEKGDQKSAFPLCLVLYQHENAIPLSDSVPLFENMGLHTDKEITLAVTLSNGQTAWISRLDVAYVGATLSDPTASAHLFCEALVAIRSGLCENDGINHLILGAGLAWQEIVILRAYTRYLQQARFRFTRNYIEKTLTAHPQIAKYLVRLFILRFEKKSNSHILTEEHEIDGLLAKELESVSSLDEDTILRRFWQLIKASLRTNYFKTNRQSLSIKLNSADIPELPLPHPMVEVFVYSPRFEGIHLRKAKIARGGIRWSERPEDFRTEVLGLMKAQQVKNAIIIPAGAKGGFVLKTLAENADRATKQKEVVACYQSFIRGLLDITDNLNGEKVIAPPHVVCFDDPDPYLVVAADKGTATFSDIANAISAEYQFWLGDAFASGGSAGYDHKKIGITARGAWESVNRHFRELGVDLKTETISVIGIGDMSGDVFGNGMIYSDNLRLIAAFDHRDIFLDPNPDPKKSFNERKRMFELPTSSWQDYNKKLISKGGGVYSRSVKSITLSPEIRESLSITATTLTPFELIRAILKAPVDLFYNGGIGTYVKGTLESHNDVGDRTNDFCRINGAELRCKVVCEGGNLGFTQNGRIEFSLQGGLINADFIDNSAGVDCSDHEVNLKILLNKEVTHKKLTVKRRNQLLSSMTNAVADHVLQDNYDQALAMSFSAHHTVQYLGLYQQFMHDLESNIDLDRAVEFLPDDKKLLERKAAGNGLSRPELAILLAYTKIHIKSEIMKSDLPDDPWFQSTLANAFPKKIQTSYSHQLQKHPLRREIIATTLSNQLVNAMGITFVYRLQAETGMSAADIVRAYTVASNVFKTIPIQKKIDALDIRISTKLQFELLHHIRQLLNLSTRWFAREGRLKTNMESLITHYSECIKRLRVVIPKLMTGATKAYLDNIIEQFKQIGLSDDMAHEIALSRGMYTALNVTEVATHHHLDLMQTATIYFEVGAQFGLVWFRDQISADSREGHWNNRARLALRDELDNLQRKLCITVIKQNAKSTSTNKLISTWIKNNSQTHARWEKMLETVHGSTQMDYTLFFVALRELWALIAESEVTY